MAAPCSFLTAFVTGCLCVEMRVCRVQALWGRPLGCRWWLMLLTHKSGMVALVSECWYCVYIYTGT